MAHSTSAARSSDVAVMRSSQVDAACLDEELSLLLREQFMKAFSLFNPVRSPLQPSKLHRCMTASGHDLFDITHRAAPPACLTLPRRAS